MAVDYARFVAEYPEYAKASKKLVEAKLQDARDRTNSAVFGNAANIDTAVMLRAAILLARSPYGRTLRIDNVPVLDSASTWEAELYQLQRAATMGLRVFGGPSVS